MSIYEIACRVVERHSYELIKPAGIGQYQTTLEEVELCAEDEEEALKFYGEPTAKPRGFVLLDAQTASAIKLVYEAIKKPEQREKYLRLSLPRLITFTWSCIK